MFDRDIHKIHSNSCSKHILLTADFNVSQPGPALLTVLLCGDAVQSTMGEHWFFFFSTLDNKASPSWVLAWVRLLPLSAGCLCRLQMCTSKSWMSSHGCGCLQREMLNRFWLMLCSTNHQTGWLITTCLMFNPTDWIKEGKSGDKSVVSWQTVLTCTRVTSAVRATQGKLNKLFCTFTWYFHTKAPQSHVRAVS